MKPVPILVVAFVPVSLALAIAFGSAELAPSRLARTPSGCASAAKAVLTALHEPARHCAYSVLLYDAGRTNLGRSSDMLTQANREALYHCRLETAGARNYLPA